MINEIEDFKFRLRLYLNGLGALAAIGFSILQLLRGDTATGIISLMGFVYFSTVMYLLIKKRNYLWKGRGFVLFIPITMINVINVHPEFGIYWAYVGVLSFFLALELRDACISVSVFLAFTFYFVNVLYPLPIQLRIYATLSLVAIFSFVLSYLIDRLLTEVNSLVVRDPLTNALNRHSFLTSVEQALSAYQRYKIPATMLIFDLDYFKSINDTYGHQAGDRVLKMVSQLVQGRLRESDQLFRYGGEEFAVLLNHTCLPDAEVIANELRSLIEKHNYHIDRTVTVSGGVSDIQHSDNPSTWIERCDKALYQAKSNGRNSIIANTPT